MGVTGEIFTLLIGLAAIMCFLRLVLGPTSGDRAVALDTFTTVTTAFLVLLGFLFRRGVYLDVALVYGILSFIGAVTVARFLEKGI